MPQSRLRFNSWTLLIPFLIGADLFALWAWAARPARIYRDWLGLGEFGDESPWDRLVGWARWQNGPRTPSGFASLFGIGELFFAGVLVVALVLLVAIPLAMRWSGGSLSRRLSAPITRARDAAIRFRVRTALVAIAILGVYLSWEVHAWRAWRLRLSYLSRAAQEASGQNDDLARLQVMRSLLVDLRKGPLRLTDYQFSERGKYHSKFKYVREGFATRDRLEREITYLSAKIAASAAAKRKYERAAANPGIAVEPDAPFPDREPEANERLGRNPALALAAYDELARASPDLVEAHSASAWIRATCRDAQYRDGKLAVRSATRACELTNWQDTGALEALAAACSEAGDFAAAVKWQQKAISVDSGARGAVNLQARLDLYMAGKPYRQE
jgi:hypothetical protein